VTQNPKPGSIIQAQLPNLLSIVDAAASNVLLPTDADKQTGVLLPNPETPTCEVSIALIIVNASVALQNPDQPTASPVPSLVEGTLQLQLANLKSTDTQVQSSNLMNKSSECPA
jgi:hypothetical protein